MRMAMHRTLTEIAMMHRMPFIVEHCHTAVRYKVIGYTGDSSVLFDIKKIDNTTGMPILGEPVGSVYGGYQVWKYIGKDDTMSRTISPEEQRRVREEERRKNNERAMRGLTRKAPPRKIRKEPVRTEEVGKVIAVDFTKKKD